MLIILLLFCLVVGLAVIGDTYLSGFLSSTIVWKWKDWVFKPIDAYLEKIWAKQE